MSHRPLDVRVRESCPQHREDPRDGTVHVDAWSPQARFSQTQNERMKVKVLKFTWILFHFAKCIYIPTVGSCGWFGALCTAIAIRPRASPHPNKTTVLVRQWTTLRCPLLPSSTAPHIGSLWNLWSSVLEMVVCYDYFDIVWYRFDIHLLVQSMVSLFYPTLQYFSFPRKSGLVVHHEQDLSLQRSLVAFHLASA